MFKTNLLKLKDLKCDFRASGVPVANVPGEIQRAFDAWQADNLDAYFVATGSFIKFSDGRWKKRTVTLGFQAVIKTYSKSKCYNPHAPEEHVPDLTESHRDVLGIVRAIAAKECSSAKRKASFCSLQKKAGSKTVLILDNSVVFDVCHASPRLHAKLFFVDAFVLKITREEKEPVKSKKLQSLLLSESEWARVKTFVGLLGYADAARQAFSCDVGPSMRLAIPALESLHPRLRNPGNKLAHVDFEPALTAGINKIAEYYDKVDSDAYIFCMSHPTPAQVTLNARAETLAETLVHLHHYRLDAGSAPLLALDLNSTILGFKLGPDVSISFHSFLLYLSSISPH
ncbi:hypothetical protein B0H13DRAFT_2653724 [Mycena leptocephala]|nr:hypothetical protein B0H13DRAFT_2653724 [Mycena leptocephala]